MKFLQRTRKHLGTPTARLGSLGQHYPAITGMPGQACSPQSFACHVSPAFRSAFMPQFSEQAAIYLFTLTLKFVWINRLSFVPDCYYIYTLYCKSAGTKQGGPLNEDTSSSVHSEIKQEAQNPIYNPSVETIGFLKVRGLKKFTKQTYPVRVYSEFTNKFKAI